MKFKFLLYLLIFFSFLEKGLADEINFISDNIKIQDEGNIINSINVEAEIPSKRIFIKGDYSNYNKTTNIITVTKNVEFIDSLNNVFIRGDKIAYNQNTDIINSVGDTFIIIEDTYEVFSKNLFYDRKLNNIYSDYETIIKDNKENVFNLEEKFIFDVTKEIISTDKTIVIDDKNNSYEFEKAKINLKTNEIAGKELQINFIDDYFGDIRNDPKLKGKSAISNNEETKIYKAAFTTCNIENKSCPGWEIQTEEFTHDKKNKSFEYKNSWLKLFDKHIFYFPYFSHPDPSVNRKSGFLTPTYGSSNEYGSWINIPYFKTLGLDQDLTFNPRIYADDKFIMQSEYRRALQNYNITSDFSFNNDGKNSNSHLFINFKSNKNTSSNLKFDYQSVTNDNYLQIHNLSNSSPLITNESLLTSQLNYSKIIDDSTSLNADFIVYEDLSKSKSDRYQYILPSFNFTKYIEIDEDYDGNFKFISTGFQKNYETNKIETLLVNDFLYESNDYISEKGFKTNYNFLVKNFNSYTENSSQYENKDDYEIFGSTLIKSSFPLKKVSEKKNSYLTPIIAARYSPNNTKNISNNDVRLSYSNIFSFNRIGTNEIVEGGKSLAIGVEYKNKDIYDNDILGISIANSLSDRKNENLPTKSKLNQTRSDIVGDITYAPNNIINFNYSFSLDKNLNYSNYDSIFTKINVNNFVTTFNFLSQDAELGNNEVLSNMIAYKFNNENSFKFNTTKDLKNDFTEYYNLIYQYESDCLLASLEYRKKFYQDGSLLPDKSLLFYIKFIPFAEIRPAAQKLQ